MSKKRIIITLVVAAMLVLAGCADSGGNDGQSKDMEKDTGVDLSGVEPGESYWFEVKYTEKNQKTLVKKEPPEPMENSLERQNLKERYQYLNDQNNQHYVYLMSHGKVVTWYTAQGKVSSINSKLTNNKQIVEDQRCLDTTYKEGHGNCYQKVESPQLDGSYGTNGDGIFFFTTDGRYVEWNGEYIVSEQPLNIRTPPELVEAENPEDYEGYESEADESEG